MSIAQSNQIRDLGTRVANIESLFRGGAEVGNVTARVDNLEQTVSGMLLELQRLSKIIATNEAATKEPQGDQWPSSQTTKSAPSSAHASQGRSTGQTQSSGASAKMR